MSIPDPPHTRVNVYKDQMSEENWLWLCQRFGVEDEANDQQGRWKFTLMVESPTHAEVSSRMALQTVYQCADCGERRIVNRTLHWCPGRKGDGQFIPLNQPKPKL